MFCVYAVKFFKLGRIIRCDGCLIRIIASLQIVVQVIKFDMNCGDIARGDDIFHILKISHFLLIV